MRRAQGFTLIELLVVIAIVAILAALLFYVFPRHHLSFDVAPNPFSDPQFFTPNSGSDFALPPSPGNYTEFDWSLETEESEQEPSEPFDFGPGIGESRALPSFFADGKMRFENVGGDLKVTSHSDNAFAGFELLETSTPDGPYSLVHNDPFSTHGELLIPAADIAGKSILDILPLVAPLMVDAAPGLNVPFFRDDQNDQGDLPIGSLTGYDAVQLAALPESASLVAWSLAALSIVVSFSILRRRRE